MRTLSLDLEPIEGGKKPEWKTLAWLLFTNWLSPRLRNGIKHVPRTSHTNTLGWLELSLERQLGAVTGPFSLSFDPGTDYQLSAAAGAHWTALALADLDATRADFARWFEAFGVRWRGRGAGVDALLATSDVPLVEVVLERKTFLVGALRGEPESFVFDVDYGPQALAELSAADRAKLADAARTGLCQCFLCTTTRVRRAKGQKPKASSVASEVAGAAAEPAATKPAKSAKSATKKPAATKPATTKPATTAKKPAATKPAATKPATTKPAATKPAATKPATKKPATKKPATKKPSPR